MRVALAAVLALSCARRDQRPEWAKQVANGVPGDPTVTGDPASVRRLPRPTLDGKLDEPFWQTATALGPFVGTGEGEAASPGHPVAAFARIGWDDQALYIGAVVGDRNPISPFGRDDVDPHLWEQSSALELMVQPGDPGDNKGYYEIQIDIAGAVFDTKWDDYNVPIVGDGAAKRFGHMDWSSRAERATFVEQGKFYSIEAAIPWKAFEGARVAVPPKPGDVWRLNLYSFRDGQRAALGWSPIRRMGNFHKSSRFGRIKFE